MMKITNGRNSTIRTPENVDRRLDALRNPNRSVRLRVVSLEINESRVRRILKIDLAFHPYKIQVCQQLLAQKLLTNSVLILLSSWLNLLTIIITWYCLWVTRLISTWMVMSISEIFGTGLQYTQNSYTRSHYIFHRSHEWLEKSRDRCWPTRWARFASSCIPALRLKSAIWLTLFSKTKFCYI